MAYRSLIAACLVSSGVLLHAQGIITTIAKLGSANGIVVDKSGNIYFTDSIFSVVRKIDTQGKISTFAGGIAPSLGDGGPATSARLGFQGPHAGLAVDGVGNVYIADYFDRSVRKVDT
jgi:DNA-binding beta-propeller fold protein YncE